MKSYLAVTASIQVYSIQKSMLKDGEPLFNTDYDILKSNLQNCSKFSAIQCAAAVPRAPAESPSSRKYEQSNLQAASEAQASELTTNGHGPPASKQASQQPKGIMGMLISKAATKTQDTNKETKPEAREVTSVSCPSRRLLFCIRTGIWGSLPGFHASLCVDGAHEQF